jgi:lipopolysaccharide transport system ATP-binding protein
MSSSRDADNLAVSVRGLSKSYTIVRNDSSHITLAEEILSRLRHPFRRRTQETFWALRDVSFDIQRGDVVGVIGRNGAGKSTLLKILSRITEPSAGQVDLYGRVGSLLEVGTGFHPELTGRENVYLNGHILGMRKSEIARHFDAIVDFSGVEQFLDTPVKRFSSGMAVRLAFAVAAHLDPEILVVDEVLAVGDMQFQKRCLGKLGEVSRQGRTVIFVSHDMRTLRNLCPRGVYLKRGQVAAAGAMEDLIRAYTSEQEHEGARLPVAAGPVSVSRFDVQQNEERRSVVDGAEAFEVTVDFELNADVTLFRLGIYLKTALGDTIARSFTTDWRSDAEDLAAGHYRAVLHVPGCLLMPGVYKLGLHASRYGIATYLSETDVQYEITLMPPASYNTAHPAEHIDAAILLRDGWQLKRRNPSDDGNRQTNLPSTAASAASVG